MHKLEVILVVVSPSLVKGGTARFLVMREDGQLNLPVRELDEQESTIEVAAQMLNMLTGLRARILGVGWVDLVQMAIVDNVNRKFPETGERYIAVPYGCMLPGEVTTLYHGRAKWLTLTEVTEAKASFFHDHYEILMAVCQRL
jgi:hypothetical protein